MSEHEHDEEMMMMGGGMGPMNPKRIWVRDITPEYAESFVNQLFDSYEKDAISPILIFIDCPGGHLDALSAMVSAMDSIPTTLITIAMGQAMSAGAMLLSHGDVRCAAPHARIMIHEVSAGAMGNVNDIEVEAKEIRRMNTYWMKWLATNCGKSTKDFQNFFGNNRREVYLSAKEAMDFGIVDKIGVPFLSTQTAKEYTVSFIETKPPALAKKKS